MIHNCDTCAVCVAGVSKPRGCGRAGSRGCGGDIHGDGRRRFVGALPILVRPKSIVARLD